jgi:hypothetical protein
MFSNYPCNELQNSWYAFCPTILSSHLTTQYATFLPVLKTCQAYQRSYIFAKSVPFQWDGNSFLLTLILKSYLDNCSDASLIPSPIFIPLLYLPVSICTHFTWHMVFLNSNVIYVRMRIIG